MTLRLAKVEIDQVFTNLDAYLQPETWNGWARPLFTKPQADALMAQANANDSRQGSPAVAYDSFRDVFLCDMTEGAEQPEEYEGRDVEHEGATLHVYGIGNCGWTWDEVEPETTVSEAEQVAEAFANVLRSWLTKE